MPDESIQKPGLRISWSSLISTILSGLLLSAFTYFFGAIAIFLLTDKMEVYFVERPITPGKRYEKLVVIDNFSKDLVDDVQFTIVAENVTTSSFVNLRSVEQSSIAPRTELIKVSGLLPNRQSSFLLTSDVFVPDDSFRIAKGPVGLRFKPKDKLVDSLVDGSQLVNALVQFLIYVVMILFFEQRLAVLRSQANKFEGELEDRKLAIQRIERSNVRAKLIQVRRILSLSKENRLWREVALSVVEQSAGSKDASKKVLNIILVKAGIRPVRTIDDLDEEDIVQSIEEAESMLAGLPKA